jgi:hypothetical protein
MATQPFAPGPFLAELKALGKDVRIDPDHGVTFSPAGLPPEMARTFHDNWLALTEYLDPAVAQQIRAHGAAVAQQIAGLVGSPAPAGFVWVKLRSGSIELLNSSYIVRIAFVQSEEVFQVFVEGMQDCYDLSFQEGVRLIDQLRAAKAVG